MVTANQLIAKYGHLGLIPMIVENLVAVENDERLANDPNFFWDRYSSMQNQLGGAMNTNVINRDYGGNTQTSKSSAPKTHFDANLERAIEESKKQANQGTYEPLTLEQRARSAGECIGLKNVGNTCYFNSLLQTFFRITGLVQTVLNAPPPINPEDIIPKENENSPNGETRRKEAATKLLQAFQDLFATLIGSNQKYTDPSPVLNNLVDENGIAVKIGDQKDIVEVMTVMLDRMDEALGNLNPNDVDEDEGPFSNSRKALHQSMSVKPEMDMLKTTSIQGGPGIGPRMLKENSRRTNGPVLQKSLVAGPNSESTAFIDEQTQAGSDAPPARQLEALYLSINPGAAKNQASHLSTRLASNKPKSYMQRLFFGKLASFIQKFDEYQEYMKTPTEVAAGEDHFGPVLLDINSSDLYQAWEQYLTSPLTGYDGVAAGTKAVKLDFISELPQVLTFQLNRVKFDRERQTAIKSNREFPLPLEIFPDRFMLKNKQLVEGFRRRIHTIEQKLAVLKSQTGAFEGFGSNKNLLGSFRDVLAFLEVAQAPSVNASTFQIRTSGDPTTEEKLLNQSLYGGPAASQMANKESVSPHSQMHPDILALMQDRSLPGLVSHLSQFFNNISARHSQLETERSDLESKIAKTYDGLDKTRYLLFSLIIHEGTPESGHYYCFIRLDGDNWVKFNDYQSKRISQQEVLEIAKGGEKINSSAYCAFYMKDEEYRRSPPHNYEIMEASLASQVKKSLFQHNPLQISSPGYQRFLPHLQKQKVLEKNRLFDYVGLGVYHLGSRKHCGEIDC